MIRVGGVAYGDPGDTEFCGLIYPDGDEISKHMAARLQEEPFYQADKLAQALAKVSKFRAAVDCGAWVGGWSRALAQRFSRVVSIEANFDSARCLQKNLADHSNTTVINAALGEVQGRVALARQHNGPNVGTRVVPAGPMSVPMWPLDTLAEVQALPAIDYIKVHVNGMELRTLHGGEQTIRRHRPVLTVVLKGAIRDFGDTPEAARAFLGRLGYVLAGGERPYEIWAPQ